MGERIVRPVVGEGTVEAAGAAPGRGESGLAARLAVRSGGIGVRPRSPWRGAPTFAQRARRVLTGLRRADADMRRVRIQAKNPL
jgi:hypothetical protein